MGVVDDTGTLVAKYRYDGYGNVTVIDLNSDNIGSINPYRYRSYYYDSESGFYYLNSRYYDPQTGRFISPDDLDYLGVGGSVLSFNLFSYCENDPINNADYNGNNKWGKLNLLDYRNIHKKIQEWFCRNNGWKMEICVKTGKNKWGFIDLYDPKKNCFYEVKKKSVAFTTKTNKQINKYKNSVIKKTVGNIRKLWNCLNRIGNKVNEGKEGSISGRIYYGAYIIDFYTTYSPLIYYVVTLDVNKLIARQLSYTYIACLIAFAVYDFLLQPRKGLTPVLN